MVRILVQVDRGDVFLAALPVQPLQSKESHKASGFPAPPSPLLLPGPSHNPTRGSAKTTCPPCTSHRPQCAMGRGTTTLLLHLQTAWHMLTWHVPILFPSGMVNLCISFLLSIICLTSLLSLLNYLLK